jgi:hypothetical protein
MMSEVLIEKLKLYELPIISKKGNVIETKAGFVIEIENENLFKLKHSGDVIAPFGDIDEMCSFINTYS